MKDEVRIILNELRATFNLPKTLQRSEESLEDHHKKEDVWRKQSNVSGNTHIGVDTHIGVERDRHSERA